MHLLRGRNWIWQTARENGMIGTRKIDKFAAADTEGTQCPGILEAKEGEPWEIVY